MTRTTSARKGGQPTKPPFRVGQVWEHRGELLVVARVWKKAVKFDLGTYTLTVFDSTKATEHMTFVRDAQ